MLRRALISFLLALAALGALVHGAGAPGMAMAAAHGEEASLCNGCPGPDGASTACGSGLCLSAVAIPSSAAFSIAAPSRPRPDDYVSEGASQADPPDPQPPRAPAR